MMYASHPEQPADRVQDLSPLRREEIALRKALLDDVPEMAHPPRRRAGLPGLASLGAALTARFGGTSALP